MEGIRMKKRKEREPLSITKQYILRYCMRGIAWLLFALFYLVNTPTTTYIASTFLYLAAGFTFISVIPNREHDDEMSLQHINRAKSVSLDLTVFLATVIGICSLLFDALTSYRISYRYVFGFIVAFSQIAAGLLFYRFEKGGE
jgi:high-affinity Fe2+/Pb2+ permease